MMRMRWCGTSLAALLAVCGLSRTADAATVPVFFSQLTASATVATPFDPADTLLMDTVVTTETGPLLQSVTFTLGSAVSSLTGAAAWEVTTADGDGPRLVGVNIDIFDSLNNLVLSDAFQGTLAGFAHSTFDGTIGPGTYKMVATGTGVRATSLDVSLSFVGVVPEPTTFVMLLSGLGVLALSRKRS